MGLAFGPSMVIAVFSTTVSPVVILKSRNFPPCSFSHFANYNEVFGSKIGTHVMH